MIPMIAEKLIFKTKVPDKLMSLQGKKKNQSRWFE